MADAGKIKLYDFPSSPNCQRVKVVLEEKQLPYETVPIDLRQKDQKKPDFLKLNPNGKVPVVVDGGTVLYESCIINEYLDEKYPQKPLLPKDPAARGKARIQIDYGLTQMDGLYQKMRQEKMKDEKEKNQGVIDSTAKELKNFLQRFERDLGDRPYLAGEFSLVDADLIPRFLRLEGFGVLPDPSLPKLSAYLKRMKERPSVRAIL